MAQETNENFPEDEVDLEETPGTGEIAEEIAEETAPGIGIEVDITQFPELATMQIGDPVPLEVSKISDDGTIITLIPSAVSITPEDEEGFGEVPGEEGTGREAVEQELLGGE